MRFKGLTKITMAAAVAALLVTGLTAKEVQAAKAMKPAVYINGLEATGEVLIHEGNIFVTLRDMKLLGDYTMSYDSALRQVTITSGESKITLVVGSKTKTLLNDGQKVTLTTAPFLHHGQTMLPLRAVTELFEGKVYWNAVTKTAYVNKTDADLQKALVSSELAEARNAAINIPRISKLPERPLVMTYMEMQGQDYYFPQGCADRFFEQNNDLLSYYEVVGDHAELKWQAKLNLPGKPVKHQDIYFTEASFLQEIGKQPQSREWTLAVFKFRYPIGATSYGFVTNGNTEANYQYFEHDTNSPDYTGIIVSIPGENTLGK